MQLFFEISLILAATTVVSFAMRMLKQPLIVGYIITGVLVGPLGFDLITAHESFEALAKFGISILLFIVGLHLSPKVIKDVGTVSLITGLGQVLFTSVVGFGIALALGIDRVAALYVAIALTFSSTIIILKLLSDKGDVQTLYGKIAIGFLLVQDLVATVLLIIISSFQTSAGLPLSTTLILTATKSIVLLVIVLLVYHFLAGRLTKLASQSSELLFLFGLSWGLGFASLFTWLGLSVEIGSLVAGVTLSATAYADEMGSRLRPLRDFFIILFFILLGSNLTLSLDASILVPVFVFSVFVLVGNPIIVILIMNQLGYHRKTGFMAGLTVAQISEFSLILASLGLQVGHLSNTVVTIITLVGLITIAGSTYLILYSGKIYPALTRILQLLELKEGARSGGTGSIIPEAFIFGFNRAGNGFLEYFKQQGYKVGVVDFDPTTEEKLPEGFKPYFYGDASNVEFLEDLPLKKAKIIISTIPDIETNKTLLSYLRKVMPNLLLISFSENKADAITLYEIGVDYVVIPFHQGADYLKGTLARIGFNRDSFSRKKEQHLSALEARIA